MYTCSRCSLQHLCNIFKNDKLCLDCANNSKQVSHIFKELSGIIKWACPASFLLALGEYQYSGLKGRLWAHQLWQEPQNPWNHLDSFVSREIPIIVKKHCKMKSLPLCFGQWVWGGLNEYLHGKKFIVCYWYWWWMFTTLGFLHKRLEVRDIKEDTQTFSTWRREKGHAERSIGKGTGGKTIVRIWWMWIPLVLPWLLTAGLAAE